jgi:hypothetical protein
MASSYQDTTCAGILRETVPNPAPMFTPIPFPPPGFDDLSTDEKIDYLALLWD